MPPSPELLAKVEALPPIKDEPNVELAGARASDHHFTLRKLLKPIALALVFGLVLDGLDAAAGLALPALVRGGIDSGVQAKAFHYVILVSLIGLAIVFADWIVNIAETMVVGRNGERLLYTLRVKLFAQLQRLGLDFYERELNGRIMTRMTSDVDALSSFLQTGLVTMVSSLLTFVGVLAAMLVINLRLGLLVLAIVPVLAVATVIFRRKSSQAYTEARERISVVNADLAENVAGLRVTQAFRREGTNREPVRRAERPLPAVPAAGAAVHLAVLPVRADAVDGRVGAGARGRGGPGAVGRALGRRADRLPALHRHGVRADPVALPGVRRVPAGGGRPAADQGPAAAEDVHAAPGRRRCRFPPPGLTGLIELRDVRFAYATGSELSARGAGVGGQGGRGHRRACRSP